MKHDYTNRHEFDADSVEFGRPNHLLDENADTPEALIGEILKFHERIAERNSRIAVLLYAMQRRVQNIQAQLREMDRILHP